MKIEDFLSRLKLNVYEKAAYLALLKLGESKAAELYKTAKVPYGRIYDSLIHMEQLGLISVVPTTPKTYKAIDPKLAFKLIIQKQQAELKQIEKDVGSIEVPILEKPASLEVSIIKSREHGFEVIKQMIQSAKSELLMALEALGGAAVFTVPTLQALNRGVKVKFILSEINEANKDTVSKLKRAGAHFKQSPLKNLRLIIRDQKETFMSVVEQRERISIFSANEAFSKSMTSFFDRLFT